MSHNPSKTIDAKIQKYDQPPTPTFSQPQNPRSFTSTKQESRVTIEYQKKCINTSKNTQSNNLSMFLKNLHSHIETSMIQQNDSQIIESQYLISLSEPSMVCPQEEIKIEEFSNKLIEAICQIKTVEEAIQLLGLFNPEISQKIKIIVAENKYQRKQIEGLQNELVCVKRDKNKLSIKYKILENQSKIFQQNCEEVSKTYNNLLDELNHISHDEHKSTNHINNLLESYYRQNTYKNLTPCTHKVQYLTPQRFSTLQTQKSSMKLSRRLEDEESKMKFDDNHQIDKRS